MVDPQRSLHVALVMTDGNPDFSGGVPAVVLERARYLVAAGHEVSVVCRGGRGFSSPTTREGFHIYPRRAYGKVERPFERLRTYSPLYLASLGKGLRQAHARTAIDLVDLQDGPAILGVAPFVRTHAIPMTFTIHGSALINPAPRPEIGRRLHIAYEKRASALAAQILPVSQSVAEPARRYGVPKQRITVVPNTIPDDLLELGRMRPVRTEGPLRLLFLARVAPEKRLDVALRAVALLPRGAIELTVVGDGPDLPAARRLAQDLNIEDRVVFHGYVRDRDAIGEFIRSNEVFVFPTIFEAMSIALLEAMASGLYPLASDIPSIREVLPDSFMFPVGDAEALAERLRLLADDPTPIDRERPALVARAAGYTKAIVYPRLMDAYRAASARDSDA